jgi:hypothetical protein
MLVKLHRIKYHDGSFSVSRIHADGQTDKAKLIGPFLQLWLRAHRQLMHKSTLTYVTLNRVILDKMNGAR